MTEMRWYQFKRHFPLVIVVVSLVMAVYSSTSQAQTEGAFRGARETIFPDWFTQSFLNFDEDIAAATSEGKRLLLFFHQAGCPYCNRLVEYNFKIPVIEQLLRQKFAVVAINMWGDREVVTVSGKTFTEKNLAAALKVNFTPTLIFFNERKQQILRLNGYYPVDKFQQALEYVSSKTDDKMSYRDYLARKSLQSSPQAPGYHDLLREEFFQRPPLQLNKAVKKRRMSAVYFESGDCRDCEILHKSLLQEPITRKLASSFFSVQLDMWSDQVLVTPAGNRTTARKWAGQLGIQFAPTVVFFDEAGKEIIRMASAFKSFHTQSIYAYAATRSYLQQPSFQRYIRQRSEQIRKKGQDVDIWQ